MSDLNPYAPPQAVLSEAVPEGGTDYELADRGRRFAASLLDGIILMIPLGLILWGYYASFGFKFWEVVPGSLGTLLALGAAVLGILTELAINGYLLKTCGQSVGKRICGIKIVKSDGSLPTLMDSFVKRRVLFACIGQIPYFGAIGSLVDVLFIFRESRKCLHDDVAGTLVVKHT